MSHCLYKNVFVLKDDLLLWQGQHLCTIVLLSHAVVFNTGPNSAVLANVPSHCDYHKLFEPLLRLSPPSYPGEL